MQAKAKILQKPNVWRIGNVTITRIQEIEILGGHPDELFEGLEPEQVQKIGWLQLHYADAFGMLNTSIHAFVLESEGKRIIVDTCVGNDKDRHLLLFNQRKGTFLTQLTEAGFPPESIDIVLCTHLHVDHVGWNTHLHEGRWIPTFPNANYLFGRNEWEYWHRRFLSPETVNTDATKTIDVTNVVTDSILPIIDSDLHTLVEIDHHVTHEVSLISTPGHTPGHVSVSIHSKGMEAIITGDIFHNPLEMAYPDLNCVFDVDPETAKKTRREFLTKQSGRNVLILGTHFSSPTGGRIVQNENTWRFDTSSI